MGYKTGRILAAWTAFLLGLVAALSLFELISDLDLIKILIQIIAGIKIPYAQWMASAHRHQVITAMSSVGFVVCAIIYCFWFYRVCRNVDSSGAYLAFTPGRAVGSWFIPVLNLWEPYQTVRDLWDLSALPGHRESSLPHLLLRIWWGCWLGAGAVMRIASIWLSFATKGPAILTAFYWAAAKDALFVVAALLALWTVVRITQRQDALHRYQVVHPEQAADAL